MRVIYHVEHTEPKKLKYRQKRKKKPRKKGRIKRTAGNILEMLILLAIAGAFFYFTFFL